MRIPNRNTLLALLMLAMLQLLLWHFRAEAAVASALRRDLAVRIQCMPDGEAMEGISFKLFYLARKKSGKYVFKKPYAGLGLSENPFRSSSESVRAVEILENYIRSEGLEEDYEAETNQYGQATVEELEEGLYLALSDTAFALPEGGTYTPVPFVFYLDAGLLGRAQGARSTGDAYTVIAKFAANDGEAVSYGNGRGGRAGESSGVPVRLGSGAGGQGAGELAEDPGLLLAEEDVPLAGAIPDGGGGRRGKDPSPPMPRSWDADAPMPQTGLLWWPVPIGLSLGFAMVCMARKQLR